MTGGGAADGQEGASRRVFVLLAHDPATGCATRVAGVVGVEGEAHHASWVPYEEAGDIWRPRLGAAPAAMARVVEEWADLADGVRREVVELEAPASPDLRGAVEAVVDELLAVGEGG